MGGFENCGGSAARLSSPAWKPGVQCQEPDGARNTYTVASARLRRQRCVQNVCLRRCVGFAAALFRVWLGVGEKVGRSVWVDGNSGKEQVGNPTPAGPDVDNVA
jgi:hypothetical protein